MFHALTFEHKQCVDWSHVTHVRLRPTARADTQYGRNVLAHIRSLADTDGIAPIEKVLSGFPPKRKDEPLDKIAKKSLRHMANEKTSGRVDENKGCLWLGYLEPDALYSDGKVQSSQESSGSSRIEALLSAARGFGGGGEGEAHKQLKLLAAQNPAFFGAPDNAEGEVEFALPSGDSIDLVFRCSKRWVAVEIKSIISGDADLLRGLFQCIKYEAVLRAMHQVSGCEVEMDVLLCVGKPLAPALESIRASLGVKVVVFAGPFS